ncbi:disease resistance protein RFL1 isoform X3 [Triticum aestivum]|uniref:disease resistance protein RFL1 isoform X3 n=1 Tax=Triticum aestivum TaxID=4565 RepID=UPI001D00C091|nr:disease resistance protein RFL1-like isoform X3 [Triticum aestivum]
MSTGTPLFVASVMLVCVAFWGYVMQLYVIPKVILGFLMPLLQDRSSSSTYRLRFLMEYIVVLYILFILDAITGVLFLRIPLYYELELAFIMYLWHPRTQLYLPSKSGATIVLNMILLPLVMVKFFTARVHDLLLACIRLRSEAARTRAHAREMRLQKLRLETRHLWGMESCLNKVHDFLESRLAHDNLLGIWGVSGVGKSSLLMQLRQSYRIFAVFHHVLYFGFGSRSTVTDVQLALGVCLGYNYEMMSLMDEKSRARVIHHSLSNTSFLLLLDELEAPVDLAAVGLRMPLGKYRHQKVIIATGSKDACALMGCAADNIIEIGCLGEDDAWSLFKDRVGDAIIDDPRIQPLAKEMAQACGGLPIALRTFAGAMSAIQDADEWRYMYKYLQARLPLSREQFADLLHNIRHW